MCRVILLGGVQKIILGWLEYQHKRRNLSFDFLACEWVMSCCPWGRFRKKIGPPCFFSVAIRVGIISDNQRDDEKNSGKKSKSIPYNEKMVAMGLMYA
jgi:hypothetical protein